MFSKWVYLTTMQGPFKLILIGYCLSSQTPDTLCAVVNECELTIKWNDQLIIWQLKQ